MSKITPELETLDQLVGGDLPVKVIRDLYPNADHFRRGVFGLLSCGDVKLLNPDQSEVPVWRWKRLFAEETASDELANMRLSLTEQGARRIG